MASRQGRKPNATNANFGSGQYSRARVGWSQVSGIETVVMMYPDKPNERDPEEHAYAQNEPGYSIRLMFMRYGRNMSLALTSLTLDELVAFEEAVKLAISLARPVVELRDKAANEAFDEGNDSFARLYRAIPKVTVRERYVREYGGSILDGSSDALAGLRRAVHANERIQPLEGGLRGGGDELAGMGEAPRVAEDEPSSTD